jgi:hypothetical protein
MPLGEENSTGMQIPVAAQLLYRYLICASLQLVHPRSMVLESVIIRWKGGSTQSAFKGLVPAGPFFASRYLVVQLVLEKCRFCCYSSRTVPNLGTFDLPHFQRTVIYTNDRDKSHLGWNSGLSLMGIA